MKRTRKWRAALLAPLLLTTGAGAALTPDEKQEIERLIGRYLQENPQVVIDAIHAWRQKQKALEARLLAEAIAELRREAGTPAAPVWGNPEGGTTVIEFSDYNCSYCKRVFPEIAGMVADDGDIRVVMKELPVLGPGSEYAARAALAARNQGKYAEFHERMMTGGARVSRDGVDQVAREVGLDLARMKQDMNSSEVDGELERNRLWAERLGITGTPAFVIGDELVPGAIDGKTMKRLVEAARPSK